MARLRYMKSNIFGYGYYDENHHKYVKENIPIVFDHYMRLYMHAMPEFDCDDSTRKTFLSRRSDQQFCSNILYLRNRYGTPDSAHPLLWKFRYHGETDKVDHILDWTEQAHNYTCYIEITKVEGESSSMLVEGMITLFHDKGSESTLFQLYFRDKHLNRSISILQTPMLNLDNQNLERNILRMIPSSGILLEQIQLPLQLGLYLARRKDMQVDTTKQAVIHHEPYELTCFQRAIRQKNFQNFTATAIMSYSYQPSQIPDGMYMQTFDVPLFSVDWFSQFPLIDITEKEMTAIYKHLHELHRNVGYGDTIDLVEYLQEPAYGKTLRLPVQNNELLFDYIMNVEEDFVRFIIGFRKDDVVPFVTVDCNHLHDFCIRESLISICSNISFLNYHDLYPDYINLYELIPEELRVAETVAMILANALDIYVIGKHRPSKLRVTKISKPRQPHLVPTIATEPSERDYVITRIMRTVRRTKELCEELNRNSRDTMVQYVVESWKRVGHWRTIPNGSKVWIEPTTCHRHQPLTEKEIHIKL